MKRIISILFTLVILTASAGFISCQSKTDAAVKTSAQQAPAQTAIINLPTAKCSSCAKHIKTAANGVDGVTGITVNTDAHTAEVKFISTKTNVSAIEHAISKSGYTANNTVRDSAAYAGLDECCKD
jgi:copper chaperone CopZ